jgi:hypothetical protein
MNHFSIEAFVKGCKTVMTRNQTREQASRELFNTYCAYLQQHQKHFHQQYLRQQYFHQQ